MLESVKLQAEKNNKLKPPLAVVERITIGHSDYSRKQIEYGNCGWVFGASRQSMLDLIIYYENLGYYVKFKTNILIRIFGIAKYKIIAEQ